MYLLARRAINRPNVNWEVLACLNDTIIERYGTVMEGTEYTALMQNGDPARTIAHLGVPVALVEVIGMGAFGIVIRAIDKMGVHRAFKVFLPPNAVRDEGIGAYIPPSIDASTDYTEITLTTRQPFKHVVAVAHHGSIIGAAPPHDLPDEIYITKGAHAIHERETLPFTVTTLVDGVNLEDFFRLIDEPIRHAIGADPVATAALHDHILILLRDSLAGLVELREADVIHLDIKAPNIMVYAAPSWCQDTTAGACRIPFRPLGQSGSVEHFLDALRNPVARWEAFIVDLGIARCVASDRHGLIPLVMSLMAFPQALLCLLEEDPERKGFVQVDRLREYGAAIDLNMFGCVIWSQLMDRTELNPKGNYSQDFKRKERAKVDFWKHVFRYDYDVLAGIARELVKSKLKKWTDPAEFLRKLKTIQLYSDKDIYASSILTDRHPEVKIKCGKLLARLGHPLDEVVDHPQFQRLRRMAQLAFVSEVFPEATHTRFSHSLRTFELTKEAVRFLAPKSLFRLIFTRRDVDHLLAAALLHDIGQYPFADTIEDLRELGDLVGDEVLKRIPHDHELVDRVLADPVRLDAKKRTLGDILRINGFSVEDILYCIHKDPKREIVSPALRVSHDLIAKVVDLDRIAYLLQDSERSGVPYGNAIDVESFLDALTIEGSYDDVAEAPAKLQLAIEESGVSAAEAVIAATYWMYRNVYARHTNRAFMTIIKTVTKQLFRTGRLDFEKYWRDTHAKSEWEALEYLHDHFKKEQQPGSVDPLNSLLTLQRIGYSRVKTIHPMHRASAPVHKLIRTKLLVDSEETIAIEIEKYLTSLRLKVPPGAVLVDIPLRNHLLEVPSLTVLGERHLSRRRRNESKDLLSYSRLASRLTRIERTGFMRIRIFFAKEFSESISQTDKETIEDRLLPHLQTVLQT